MAKQTKWLNPMTPKAVTLQHLKMIMMLQGNYSYWTSTKGEDNKAYAINLNDRSIGQESRTVGLNIRPVKNVNQ